MGRLAVVDDPQRPRLTEGELGRRCVPPDQVEAADHALEHTRHGQGHGPQSYDRQSHLARLRPRAAPDGDLRLSPDPLLIEKVRDIVGLYLNPPDHAVVFCVDVKPQIQALDRTAPLLPLQPGQVERRTHDYTRHGTTSLYAALNVQSGQVTGRR